jgi:hypothetical protein
VHHCEWSPNSAKKSHRPIHFNGNTSSVINAAAKLRSAHGEQRKMDRSEFDPITIQEVEIGGLEAQGKSKYQTFVDEHLSVVCKDGEYGDTIHKVFGWIYDLRDRECQEVPDLLEHRFFSVLVKYSKMADSRILKLRKQLSELQIKMVLTYFALLSSFFTLDLLH